WRRDTRSSSSTRSHPGSRPTTARAPSATARTRAGREGKWTVRRPGMARASGAELLLQAEAERVRGSAPVAGDVLHVAGGAPEVGAGGAAVGDDGPREGVGALDGAREVPAVEVLMDRRELGRERRAERRGDGGGVFGERLLEVGELRRGDLVERPQIPD